MSMNEGREPARSIKGRIVRLKRFSQEVMVPRVSVVETTTGVDGTRQIVLEAVCQVIGVAGRVLRHRIPEPKKRRIVPEVEIL